MLGIATAFYVPAAQSVADISPVPGSALIAISVGAVALVAWERLCSP